MTALPVLMGAFVAGLVGSPHCVGMCGAFAASCGSRLRDGVLWHLGRLATYASLGAIAGGLGSVIPGPGWIAIVVSTALIVWFAAALGGWAPEPGVWIPGLGRLARWGAASDHAFPKLAYGVATGLLPCGLVYAALAVPVALASAPLGAVAMALFWAGTVPALATFAVGVRKWAAPSSRRRKVLALGVLVAGLLSVAVRGGLISGPGMDHDPGTPATHSDEEM